MSLYTETISILNNHAKLISMINPKLLPIKQTLLDDVANIKIKIEKASVQNKHKEGDTHGTK
jgi:hypothetical protein